MKKATYVTKANNLIFNHEGFEFVIYDHSTKVKLNTGNFTTAEAKTAIDIEERTIEITGDQMLQMADLILVEKAKKLRSQLLPVKSVNVKIPAKEKREIVKQYSRYEKFYQGEVIVTDSSRAKGGYFRYSDETFKGLFVDLKNEIYTADHKLIVSSRKKNYKTNRVEIASQYFYKLLFANMEKERTLALQISNQKANAVFMFENAPYFKEKIVEALSK